MKKIVVLLVLFNIAVFAQQKSYYNKDLTDARDGKKYKIVTIGTQTWMAENLNYNANSSVCYDNKLENCQKYGRLYNWETARLVCPIGWHLPTKAEWDLLESGTKVKYLLVAGGWGGNNIYGGYTFLDVGYYGRWWSASEYNSAIAYRKGMDYDKEHTYWGASDKPLLFSVRCVRD
jgi:uncharacterized protein (TIGR02145 family)